MVAAAVRELGRRDVEYSLACALRNLVHEAHEVLVGIPEPHTPAYSALEIAGAAAHVEGDHTLVLVPYVHHTVQFLYSCGGLEFTQKGIPIGSEFAESPVHFRHVGISGYDISGDALVEQSVRGEFLRLGILGVTEDEYYVRTCSGGKLYVYAVSRYRTPAVGYRA